MSRCLLRREPVDINDFKYLDATQTPSAAERQRLASFSSASAVNTEQTSVSLSGKLEDKSTAST